jgi:hypothetical protein
MPGRQHFGFARVIAGKARQGPYIPGRIGSMAEEPRYVVGWVGPMWARGRSIWAPPDLSCFEDGFIIIYLNAGCVVKPNSAWFAEVPIP